MPFISVIQPGNAEGRLKEIYDSLERTRGKIAEIHKVQSLNPGSLFKHMDLYMTLMYEESPLSRVQREILGLIVSVSNECSYCQEHHAQAVLHFWKDRSRVDRLIADYRSAGLEEVDRLLCDYARELTKHPGGKWKPESFIAPLKELGLDDRAILDATLIISYFNFVNRLVMALGIEVEDEPGGYIYE